MFLWHVAQQKPDGPSKVSVYHPGQDEPEPAAWR